MKKILLFILICLNINYFCLAQPDRNPNKAEALQVAYLTRELGLTTEEAQRFWPVFQNYRQELKKARQQNENELEWEEKALNIRKKYKAEFGKVLNEQRVDRFFKAERGFRDMLRKEQMRRQSGGSPMKPKKRFQ